MTHGPAFWLPNIIQPIGTVSIGIAGFILARRQWLVSNEKFRFDLFEERFKIYQDASSNLSQMMRDGDDNISIVNVECLDEIVVKARLFFGESVAHSLQQAASSGRRLFAIKNGGVDYRMRSETIDLQDKLLRDIVRAGTTTLTVMQGFIDFSKVGQPRYFDAFWRFRHSLDLRLNTLWRRIRGGPSST